MARQPTITDERLLEAAREVFLERGIRATSAEVAARAGVSEGTLFKRFRTKDELFHRAMRIDDETASWERTITGRVGAGEVREHVAELLVTGIATCRIIVPLVLMSATNPLENKLMRYEEPTPLRTLRVLGGYFEAEMRLGRLRPHDAEVSARMLMSAAWHYAHFELLNRAMDMLPMPEGAYVRGVVDTLMGGLAPEPEENAR